MTSHLNLTIPSFMHEDISYQSDCLSKRLAVKEISCELTLPLAVTSSL